MPDGSDAAGFCNRAGGSLSVRRQFIDMIHNKKLDRAFLSFKAKSELRLDRLFERRACFSLHPDGPASYRDTQYRLISYLPVNSVFVVCFPFGVTCRLIHP